MSTTVVPPAESPKQFDPAAHMRARNEAEHALKTGQPVMPKEPEKPAPGKPEEKPASAPAAVAEPEDHQDHQTRLPRSVRREMNRLREELGETRGRLKAYEELGMKPKAVEPSAPAAPDPEPQRGDFASDAEYNRALGRWEARQETQKTLSKRDEQTRTAEQETQFRQHLEAMDAKAREDIKLLPDWDATAKAAAESEDAVEVDWAEHSQLLGMIGASDFKAFVLYHFAKEPAEFEKMLALTKDKGAQIRAFHRLEGRLEKQYSDLKAAQAAEPGKPTPKDRTHLAEADEAGRTAADRDVRKPRPSAVVAAPGGSAPPEEPKVGSAAWMARRNAANATSRY